MASERKEHRETFLALLEPIQRELEVYCRRMLWDANEIEDTIQNTLLRAFKAFDRYHQDASFKGWMFKILTNEIFYQNRKRNRTVRRERTTQPEEMDRWPHEQSPPFLADPLSIDAVSDALDEEIVAALKKLTETERAVLLLRGIGGFRYREVSEALEMPMGSVMGHLSRARYKMRAGIATARRTP